MTMEHPFQTILSVGLSNKLMETPGFTPAFNRIELLMHLPLSWPAGGKRLQFAEYQWPEEWLRTLARSICEGAIPLLGPHLIISNEEPLLPLEPQPGQALLFCFGMTVIRERIRSKNASLLGAQCLSQFLVLNM